MFDIGEKIYSNVSGRTYIITWASETITMAEVGFASTDRDGDVYFIKRLLNMKYPLDSTPGSPTIKAKRRELCDNHYKKYSRIYSNIEKGCGDGACVPIIDYFREGAFYYTVYRKINASSLSLYDISSLSENDKYRLLLRLVQGLMPMHALGIIHGDLKPENILVQSVGDDWRIRLIDMNDCYLSGEPNSPGMVVGTPDYYSPELLKYNTYEFDDEEDPDEIKHVSLMAQDLTTKADVFALGIIFSEFYCGHRPSINKDGIKYIHEAVLDGGIKLDYKIPEKLRDLVSEMLNKDFHHRPSVNEVGKRLKSLLTVDKKLSKPCISFVKKDGAFIVTISSDSSYPIFYTIDGSIPDLSSLHYTEPFVVSEFTTVRAALINGKKKSDVESKQAWIKTDTIRIKSKSPRIIVLGRSIKIEPNTSSPELTKIYFTLDGSTPTKDSKEYSGEFIVDNNVSKIKAVAVEPGLGKLLSNIVEAKVYKLKIPKPTIHYKRGIITIESAEDTVTYYTIDGTIPNDKSIIYSEPFMVSDTSNFIIQAISINSDGEHSETSFIKRPNSNVLIK